MEPENELPTWNDWLYRSISPAPELERFCCNSTPAGDGPILYADSKNPEVQVVERFAARQGSITTRAQRAFAVTPPQTTQIGSRIFTQISFVTPVSVQESLPGRNEDGLLPTVLFQRVLISGDVRYVVLDPK